MERKLSNYEHRLVRRITAILNEVSLLNGPSRLTDIAAATGIDSGTVYRILSQLVREGYVYKDKASRRYSIGFEMFRLGASQPARAATVERAHIHLTRLALEVSMTVLVASRHGREVYLYKKVPGPYDRLCKIDFPRRRFVDAHATAVGKVLLAFASTDEVDALYRDAPLQGHTSRTKRQLSALLVDLNSARGSGYALDSGELVEGVCGIGVPIINPVGEVNLALWLICPAEQYRALNIPLVVNRARATMDDFIEQVTGRPPLASVLDHRHRQRSFHPAYPGRAGGRDGETLLEFSTTG